MLKPQHIMLWGWMAQTINEVRIGLKLEYYQLIPICYCPIPNEEMIEIQKGHRCYTELSEHAHRHIYVHTDQENDIPNTKTITGKHENLPFVTASNPPKFLSSSRN